ncbi:methenyltetrahydrofolate cyclohydrolase [Oxobacter pfennigii]|uniref:Methenyltetrahydrofolate cyclohydrolase n=1 Tax=Oxobacter pfennigii TaxID=36849 RepID=A0A0P9ACC3_9CLOT|nr:cyclodeaminase/cyclohydrolase family protein [Oxobacter pfennigii]KPU42748.1 methenyltetrahydrofolate cyclohydrolase [Oxobacter pfennigii]
MLINMTLSEFIDETASNSPAPGGGSASALAGALGASLSSMVAELSMGKEMDEGTKNKAKGTIRICKDLIRELKEGVDKDTQAFNRVMDAFKMPKATEDEKNKRSEAIQEAMKEAAELPYETALLCIDVMNVALDMLKAGNKNAASDAAVSGFMGYAALNGAVYNIKINLNSIKDTEYANEMRAQAQGLIKEGDLLLEKIKSAAKETIG